MINKFINILKWPIAIFMLWSIPASVFLLIHFISLQINTANIFSPLLIGFFGYLILWRIIFKRHAIGSYFSTLEHECTHGIFAILTGNSVKGMKVTAHEGGHLSYEGEGNWLITVAPYFFPTITVLLMLVRIFIDYNYWFEVIIGASIAFHLTSTYLETHGAQTDLQNVGKKFALLFLPSANIIIYILIIIYVQSGFESLVSAVEYFSNEFIDFSKLVVNYLTKLI